MVVFYKYKLYFCILVQQKLFAPEHKRKPNSRDINLRRIMDPELEAYEQMGEQDAFNYDGIILRRSDPDDCD